MQERKKAKIARELIAYKAVWEWEDRLRAMGPNAWKDEMCIIAHLKCRELANFSQALNSKLKLGLKRAIVWMMRKPNSCNASYLAQHCS